MSEEMRIAGKDAKRFWEKVNACEPDKCWLWIAGRRNKRYGQFKLEGKQQSAHRVAWQLARGDIPTGLCVLHHCDNPLCVNPSHLFIGSHADNARDRNSKDRQARGERHGRVKLTEENVLEIVNLGNAGNLSQREIGGMYGIHRIAVGHILLGKSWGWLTGIQKGAMVL